MVRVEEKCNVRFTSVNNRRNSLAVANCQIAMALKLNEC